MSIGPLNDVIITITNVIRKSEHIPNNFTGSDEAEALFDDWQDHILDLVRIIHDHWNDDNLVAEWASTSLENSFKAMLLPIKETNGV
jgi:hypothetical protein